MVYAGLLRRSYEEAKANPVPQNWYWQFAKLNFPAIRWLGNEHPLIWNVAPLVPPVAQRMDAWAFVKANGSLLCWIGIFYGGVWSGSSASYLLKLIDEVSREEKKEKIRRVYVGGQRSGVLATTLIAFRADVELKAAESGKWWSPNGAIVGGCIAGVLAQVINVLLGFAKP